MRIGSLFSGYGGLEMLLPGEVRWSVDLEATCRTVLEAHYDHPILEDVRDVSGGSVEPVDCLVGGFPCQPVSQAGQRKAQADDRWLWPEFARIISDLQPRVVFVENVRGLLNNGGSEVLADLADLGYDAEWRVIPAANVGAPHQRERVFMLATLGPMPVRRATPPARDRDMSSRPLLPTPNKWDADRGPDLARARRPNSGGMDLVTTIERLLFFTGLGGFGDYSETICLWETEIGRAAPAPRGTNGRLNPPFVEWMMGLPEGWVTDPTLDLSRTVQLRILGNGVVPQQAAHAYTGLLSSLPF